MAATMSVSCYTCLRTAWEGDELPAGKDGQAILTEFAGPEGQPCPGNNAACPHKPSARAQQLGQRPATVAELESLKVRIGKLEAGKP